MSAKPEYQPPTVEQIGSFEEITKASATGPFFDFTITAGQPQGPIPLTNNLYS